jgi:hypothetical protein
MQHTSLLSFVNDVIWFLTISGLPSVTQWCPITYSLTLKRLICFLSFFEWSHFLFYYHRAIWHLISCEGSNSVLIEQFFVNGVNNNTTNLSQGVPASRILDEQFKCLIHKAHLHFWLKGWKFFSYEIHTILRSNIVFLNAKPEWKLLI